MYDAPAAFWCVMIGSAGVALWLAYAAWPHHAPTSAIYGMEPTLAAAKIHERQLDLVVCGSQARLKFGEPTGPTAYHVDFSYPMAAPEFQAVLDCMAGKGYRVENGVIYVAK